MPVKEVAHMKLYSGPLSLFTGKVRVALDEKGLAHELVSVPFSRSGGYQPKHPDVLAINPKAVSSSAGPSSKVSASSAAITVTVAPSSRGGPSTTTLPDTTRPLATRMSLKPTSSRTGGRACRHHMQFGAARPSAMWGRVWHRGCYLSTARHATISGSTPAGAESVVSTVRRSAPTPPTARTV